MNLLLFTTIIAAVSAAQLPSNNYLPSNQGGGSQGGYPQNGNGGGRFPGSGGSGGIGGRFPGSGVGGNGGGNGRFPGGSGSGGNGNTRPQQEAEKNAQILKQDQDINENGFHYSYETSNGIRAEEAGDANQSQGGFSYQGDDGNTYSIVFTAGEGGFRPQGDHLPVAPPTPEAILEALEQNAKDEAAGIFDDGLYRPDANGNGGNGGGHGSGSGYLSGKGPGSSSGQAFPSGHGAGSSSRPGSSNHQGGFDPNSGYSY